MHCIAQGGLKEKNAQILDPMGSRRGNGHWESQLHSLGCQCTLLFCAFHSSSTQGMILRLENVKCTVQARLDDITAQLWRLSLGLGHKNYAMQQP